MEQTTLSRGISSNLYGYGGGGGGDAARTPVESPDSLRSISLAKILDLVSEGEVYGPADTANPLSCFYLNETPIANADGSLNFKNVQVDWRYGTQDQSIIKGFEAVESEGVVNVQLQFGTPWIHTITNLNVTAFRLTISTPAMSHTDNQTGDIGGTSVGYTIEVQTDGGAYGMVLNGKLTGKTTSKYQRSHRINLPPATTGWNIRVTRTTADSGDAYTFNRTDIDSIAEIIDAKFRMPMSAVAGIVVDSEQFNNIPSRAFHWKGRIIRVPSNYNAETRQYTGIWDGTFQLAYTNNPAWIFYDLVTNTRYGLGKYVTAELIDKWNLYTIAQYCDEMVTDGFGGTEPRFTCNIYLQQRRDALRWLQDIASCFRGIMYAAGGVITAVGDMPSDVQYIYTPANVIDGKFNYSGSSRRARHTVALVSWNDLSDFGRAKVEYIDDPEGIARYGVVQTEVIAMGCTSRGQARRLGKYLLLTERYETDLLTFDVGMDGVLVAPGKVIGVADPLRANARRGGRIRSATINTVTLDKAPSGVVAGDSIMVTLPSGEVETRLVDQIVGDVITTTVNFTAIPVVQSVWAVESAGFQVQRFKVLAAVERDGGGGYTIVGLQQNMDKFAAVEDGLIIHAPPIRQMPSSVVPTPTNLAVSSREVREQNIVTRVVTLTWDAVPVATSYEVQWRAVAGNWINLGTVGQNSIDIHGIVAGGYEVQVIAINSLGQRSVPAFGGPYDVLPVSNPPVVIGEIQQDLSDEVNARLQGDIDAIAAASLDAQNRVDISAAELQAQVDVLNGQVGDIMAADDWSASVTYDVGEIVKYDNGSGNKLYRSLQVSNINHNPATDAAWWEYIGDYASLGEAVSATAAQVSVNTSDISTLEGVTSTHTSQINALQTTVNDPSTGLAAVNTAISSLDSRVDVTESTISTHTSQINALTTTVNDPSTGLAAVNSAVTTLDSRVDIAESSISTHTSQINALQTTVNDPSTGLAAVNTAISSLDSRVDVTESTISTHTSQITSLQTTVNDPSTGLAAVNSAVSSLDSRVDITESSISTHTSQITSLQTSVAGKADTTALNALDARVTTAEGSITSHSSSITSLNASVGAIYGVGGANILSNTSGELGTTGWVSNNAGTLTAFSFSDGYQLRSSNQTVSGTHYVTYQFPASSNETCTFSVDVYATNGATGSYYIDCVAYDASNAVVTDGANTYFTANGQWQRKSVSITTGTGTTKILVRIVCDTGTYSLLGWRRAKLEYGSVATPFSNEATTAGKAEASAVVALDARVDVTEAGITQYNASYSVQLNANGIATGFTSVTNGVTSEFKVQADKFVITSSTGTGSGQRLEYSGNNLRIYDTGGVLRVRLGVW